MRPLVRAVGLTGLLRRSRYVGRLILNASFRRREWTKWVEYRSWRRHAPALGPSLLPLRRPARRALIVAKGTSHGAQIEVTLIKALELAGFEPVVLADHSFDRYFRLAGVRSFIRWPQFTDDLPVEQANALVSAAATLDDLLAIEHAGARVGKFAVSTTFRTLLVGRLDLALEKTRRTLTRHLAEGMTRADAAHRMVQHVAPDLALFMGNRYTGQGELLDICVERGVDVLTWFDAHRSSSLMLKRYRLDNRDRHHGSISDESWAALRALDWTPARRAHLRRELHDNYAAGDWYSRGGTQVNKSIAPMAEVRSRLGLDPARKTAVIFPHIVWDATLFWGTDLFNNYEDWLVETARAACANPRVNWIIKIHPAHVAKNAMDKYQGEVAELVAIRERVGPLPDHVKVIPPDTDLNTYSLFGLIDYCLTVRGTIGIEAASFGIRVLTAGTGRYDHRGFTTDSDTREQYLARIAAIDSLGPLSAPERQLAERFAYGAFVLRPLPLTSLSIEHERDLAATTRISLNARSSAELRQALDLNRVAEWAADGRQEDFLWADAPTVSLDRSA